MLLNNKEQVESIQNREVTYVKNFASLEREYDFNLLSRLMEENDLMVGEKTSAGILKDVFQIYKVSNTLEEFKTFFDFLGKFFEYEKDPKDEVDLFFSFVSQVGRAHLDAEDIFIIGLKGTTIYRVFDNEDKDYYIEKGDMIFIPRGKKHKVIGMTPRIVMSVGFYGRRLNDR